MQVDEKLFLYASGVSICEALKYSLLCGNDGMFEKALGQLEVRLAKPAWPLLLYACMHVDMSC